MATPPDGDFDAARFVEHWRNAEPQLRRGVLRFGVAPDDVDDLLAEVALRMFRAQVHRPTLREFVRFAEAIGRNIMMKRQAARRGADRTEGSSASHPDDAESGLAIDYADEAEALEWRLAIRQAMEGRGFAELSANDRRAIELLLRGPLRGGYTVQERGVIFRARRRLRDVFDELFCGVGFAWLRMRNRADELRNPSPVLPALAAVVSAAAIGVFPASDASVAPPASVAALGVNTVAAAVMAPTRPVSAPVVRRDQGAARLIAGVGGTQGRPGPAPSGKPPLDVKATARLPSGEEPGEAYILALRPPLQSETWVAVEVNCRSMTTSVACQASELASK